MEVHNLFQVLDKDSTERYRRFEEANKEAIATCIPKRERSRKASRSKHPDVIEAGERMKEACQKYTMTSAKEDTEKLSQPKEFLFSTYDKLRKKELMRKVDQVQQAHGQSQYRQAWKVINEICGRKKPKDGQVAGVTPEERVSTWFTHFQKLLDSAPSVEECDEEIPTVFSDLNIDDGPFTAQECTRVKASLKQGKSSGPDSIPPEVLKNCELGDIILKICNLALTKNNKPEKWSLSLFNIGLAPVINCSIKLKYF